MKFCSTCGGDITSKIPPGDNRTRYVCVRCDAIHYQNPRIVTGCVPYWQDQVLLCKRAIDPRSGYWTLPAGFLENRESVSDGARRETLEEANARVDALRLYTVFSLPHISQVYMFYLAELSDLNFSAGEESLAVELFSEADIPWDNLAFPVIRQTLEHYFEEKDHGNFDVYYHELDFSRR